MLCDRSETLYSSLENFLSQADHQDDLHSIQDGYSLAISELLGNDIPGCPSVSSDLNNLQTGMGLSGPEVIKRTKMLYSPIHKSMAARLCLSSVSF